MTRSGGSALTLTTFAALAVIVAMPLLFVLLQAVFPRLAEASFAQPFGAFAQAFGDTRILQLAANTAGLGLGVCIAALLLALPLALLRGLTRLPGAALWDAAFLVPIMIPPYVGAFAWVLMLQPGGYSSQLTGVHAGQLVFSVPGIVLVMALHLFPVIYFAASCAFAAIGARYAEAARVCGASAARTLIRVTLPLAAPSLAAALLLVFALTIEEYGTPATLGAQAGFEVLVTAIEERMNDHPIDIPGAALLSLVLVVLALLAYFAQQRLLSRGSHSTVTGRAAQPVLIELGPWTWAAQALFALVALAATLLPIAAVVLTASTRTLSGGIAADNFTSTHFVHILNNNGGALGALGTSLGLAAGAALCTGVLGSLIAWITTRTEAPGRRAVDALSVLPNAIPGMVVAVGLILAWNQSWWPVTIYNTVAILLVAYVCLLLPYPVRYVGAGLRQISTSLDAAARVCGAGTGRMLRTVLLPLTAPHLLVAMAVVFAIATRELVTSVMLAPPGVKTVATFVFRQFEQGSPAMGMAMSVVAIFTSTGLLIAMHLVGRRLGAETA